MKTLLIRFKEPLMHQALKQIAKRRKTSMQSILLSSALAHTPDFLEEFNVLKLREANDRKEK